MADAILRDILDSTEVPHTEIIRITQLQVYSPKGWIIAAQAGTHDEQEPEDGFVGVWSVNDNGDVPPRFRIERGKSTLLKPRGVVLDPKHKELIVSDMRRNAVLTFYFPETSVLSQKFVDMNSDHSLPLVAR